VASGRGTSLGAALVDLFSSTGRPGGVRSSYSAKGWQAQFSQLSSTHEGYEAMRRVGLSASIDTQRAWLSGRRDATPANRGLIAEAYRIMQGGFSASWRDAVFNITGRVTMGSDSRDRGNGRHSSFRVEGDQGRWDRIEEAWNAGADADTIEELFIEDVVIEGVDGISDSIEFNGTFYVVSAQ
jgi:hypothetical protein